MKRPLQNDETSQALVKAIMAKYPLNGFVKVKIKAVDRKGGV